MYDDAAGIERLQHKAAFLFARGKTSPAMDDWNSRLAQLATLAGESPSWFERRTMSRVLAKLGAATDAQLAKTGLRGEWEVAWAARQPSARGAAN